MAAVPRRAPNPQERGGCQQPGLQRVLELPRGSGSPLWDAVPCTDTQPELVLGTAPSCILCSHSILCTAPLRDEECRKLGSWDSGMDIPAVNHSPF